MGDRGSSEMLLDIETKTAIFQRRLFFCMILTSKSSAYSGIILLYMENKKIVFGVVGLAIVALLGGAGVSWYLDRQEYPSAVIVNGDFPKDGTVLKVDGEIVCLERRDGAKSDECVYGLKADDGNLYKLWSISSEYLLSGKVTSGKRAHVEGPFYIFRNDPYEAPGKINADVFESLDATPPPGKGALEGKVSVGPVCPVEREGEPCNIPAEVYTSREVLVFTPDKKSLMARAHLDTEGKYRFELDPGTYVVELAPSGIDRSGDLPKTIVIEAGKSQTFDFSVDTGIR